MTVLLPTDHVVLAAPGGLDGHGWRQGGGEDYWEGEGALQLGAGVSQVQAASGGGRGPHGPAADLRGELYLPAAARPGEGHTARVRGREFTLSQVRWVADPLGGQIGCWVATAGSTDSWPDGEPREEEA